MSLKLNICPITVSEQRLAQKEAEVEKQLDQTVEFIAGVRAASSLLCSHYKRQYQYLHSQFTELHNALNQREQEMGYQLDKELQAASTSNEKLLSAAESCIENTKRVSMLLHKHLNV